MSKQDNTKAMQDALQAAVARLNGQPAAPEPEPAMPTDPIGIVASLLPKLLKNNDADDEDEQEDVLERLDLLQREELTPLREDVRVLAKQVFRMSKAFERLAEQMEMLNARQDATGRALANLAKQMARVQILEDVPSDVADFEHGPDRASAPGPTVPLGPPRPRGPHTGEGVRNRPRPAVR